MWAYKVLFELPYEEPWRLRRRLRIDYPIAGDRLLGGGRAVPQRVQTALRRPALDKAVSAFYMSWDLVPHGALAWLLLRHPRRFPRSAAMLGATIDLTLLGYWLVPTAPPWWASRVGGRMDGEVHRVFTETRRGVRGRRIDDGHDSRGANPWAAMPSDHLASCVMLAIVLAELGPLPGALGSAYAAAMAFALAYLGEHYATDMLAGLTLALAVRAAEPAAREPLAALVERFETAARSAR